VQEKISGGEGGKFSENVENFTIVMGGGIITEFRYLGGNYPLPSPPPTSSNKVFLVESLNILNYNYFLLC
jgi:hypothetical protein